jgi:major membrane immunogen (membrane-anchored lipoprotein)
MKNSFFILIVFMLMAFTGDSPYKDGCYTGVSRSIYTAEPFYGYSKVTLSNGRIVQIQFCVRDSDAHEIFDGRYEKHYTGNEVYVNQCRNDWKGVQSYPDSLIRYQDLDKVDVISGATWSYNIFRDATREALKKARENK